MLSVFRTFSECVNTSKDGDPSDYSLAPGSVSGYYNVGGIVGWLAGGDILYCYNYGTVTGTGNYVGGMVGKITGTVHIGQVDGEESGDTEADGCYSFGDITGASYVGGMAGGTGTSTSDIVTFSSVFVYGKNNTTGVVITGDNSGSYTGGIIGYIKNGTSLGDYTFVDNGSVTGASYVGGIVGYCAGTARTLYSRKMTVLGNSYVGGAVGYAYSVSTATVDSNVEVNAKAQSSTYIGGVVGYTESGCYNCTSSAQVGDSINYGQYVGGIIGGVSTDSTEPSITSCTVTTSAKIIGYAFVGGIVGDGYNVYEFTSCSVAATNVSSISTAKIKAYYGMYSYDGNTITSIGVIDGTNAANTTGLSAPSYYKQYVALYKYPASSFTGGTTYYYRYSSL